MSFLKGVVDKGLEPWRRWGGEEAAEGEEEWGGKSLGRGHCTRRRRSIVVAPFLPGYVVTVPALPCLLTYLEQKSIVFISVRVNSESKETEHRF